MSFRDLRALTENLRVLGYPRLVSMESFRESNFKLVAEILIWICGIYEPKEMISNNIESEHDRVNLIKTVTNIFMTKQHIRLNPKRLYQADGYAVKEILKLIVVLVQAIKTTPSEVENNNLTADIKQPDIRSLRENVARISRTGAALHEALDIEVRSRQQRQRAIMSHRELKEVERAIREATAAADKNAKMAYGKLESAAGDGNSVQAKIEKKRAELERTQKRLRQLNQLRPAYQDELDELQTDLKILYDEYAIKYRNAVYLEQLLEEERKNQPQAEQIMIDHENDGPALDDPGLESFDEDGLSTDEEDEIMNGTLYRRQNLSDDDLSEGSTSLITTYKNCFHVIFVLPTIKFIKVQKTKAAMKTLQPMMKTIFNFLDFNF